MDLLGSKREESGAKAEESGGLLSMSAMTRSLASYGAQAAQGAAAATAAMKSAAASLQGGSVAEPGQKVEPGPKAKEEESMALMDVSTFMGPSEDAAEVAPEHAPRKVDEIVATGAASGSAESETSSGLMDLSLFTSIAEGEARGAGGYPAPAKAASGAGSGAAQQLAGADKGKNIMDLDTFFETDTKPDPVASANEDAKGVSFEEPKAAESFNFGAKVSSFAAKADVGSFMRSVGSVFNTTAIPNGQSLLKLFKGTDLLAIPADKYTAYATLRQALEAGHTVLVKGSWLLTQCVGSAGGRLPRRQELEEEFPEAIWKTEDIIEKAEKGKVGIIAVSYCWLSLEHPDPNGEQMRAICRILRQLLDSTSLEDTAMFIDWLSLHQNPRSPGEQEQFELALRDVHLWFAHSVTRKWMVTKVPAEAERAAPYKDRGWPTVERALCEMITKGSSLLDLGKMDGSCPTWDRVLAACKAQRRVPALPEIFNRMLRDKAFAPGESDYDLLSQMYTTAFNEVILASETLNYSELEWDDEEVLNLCAVIPRCVRLRKVALYGNKVGEKGAMALVEAVSKCKVKPEEPGVELWLTNNPISRSRDLREARDRCEAAWEKAGLLHEHLHW